jgi:Ca-activated chloride channel family protein
MTDSAADRPGFTVTVHNNPHRALGDRSMEAVIEVTARGIGERFGEGTPEVAEVILVDGSGSMNYPSAKILAARHATKTAINVLREGTRFAVVAGTGRARMLYPKQSRLAVADPTTRAAAARAVDGLRANGGTAISTWLRLAKTLLAAHPDAVRHVLLFTDGRNESESRTELDAALAECAERFTCDARGIGTNWEPAEVLRIVSALGGQGDAVREYADMADELAAIMERVMRKQVAEVGLRLRAMTGASIGSFEQVYPTRVDLTERLVPGADGGLELATGSWGDETRQYLLGLDIDPTGKTIEAESVAARIEPVVPGEDPLDSAKGLVLLCWTEDAQRSVVLDPTVAHVTDQAGLQQAIDAGCAALSKNDSKAAIAELGKAVRLAYLSRHTENLRRLGRLVIIDDAEQGIVRLRDALDLVDLLSAEMGSVMTTRGGNERAAQQVTEPEAKPSSTTDPVCAACGFVAVPGDQRCEACGEPLDGAV